MNNNSFLLSVGLLHKFKIIHSVVQKAKSCESTTKNLKALRSSIFSFNLISVLQPTDQKIIKNIKQHYTKRIEKKNLIIIEEDANINSLMTLLDAIRDLSKT